MTIPIASNADFYNRGVAPQGASARPNDHRGRA